MQKQKDETSCSVKEVVVQQNQLPLSCPMDGMSLWNAHPKVYLPIENSGKADCPYCGTRYLLNHD